MTPNSISPDLQRDRVNRGADWRSGFNQIDWNADIRYKLGHILKKDKSVKISTDNSHIP
jgi:hypothetical protein